MVAFGRGPRYGRVSPGASQKSWDAKKPLANLKSDPTSEARGGPGRPGPGRAVRRSGRPRAAGSPATRPGARASGAAGLGGRAPTVTVTQAGRGRAPGRHGRAPHAGLRPRHGSARRARGPGPADSLGTRQARPPSARPRPPGRARGSELSSASGSLSHDGHPGAAVTCQALVGRISVTVRVRMEAMRKKERMATSEREGRRRKDLNEDLNVEPSFEEISW